MLVSSCIALTEMLTELQEIKTYLAVLSDGAQTYTPHLILKLE